MPGAAAIAGLFGLAGTAIDASTAKQQMKFQKHMYRHRYQYQMEDMREAGLNPILAYRQAPPGGPGGARTNVAGAMASTGANVSNALVAKSTIAQLRAQTARTGAETDLAKAKENTEFMNQMRAGFDITNVDAHTAESIARTRLLEAQAPYAENMAAVWRGLGPPGTAGIQLGRQVGRGVSTARGLSMIRKSFLQTTGKAKIDAARRIMKQRNTGL